MSTLLEQTLISGVLLLALCNTNAVQFLPYSTFQCYCSSVCWTYLHRKSVLKLWLATINLKLTT